MTNYPAQIDTTTSLPTVVDNSTAAQGLIVNRLRDAILAVEDELGVKPSGIYGTIRSRLDTLETTIGNLQIINLAGDLGNTLIDPLVIGIQGRPVSSTAPSLLNVLIWDGIAWVPGPPVNFSKDLAGNNTSQTVIGIQGNPVLTQILGACQEGYALSWDSINGYWKAKSPTVPNIAALTTLAGQEGFSVYVASVKNPWKYVASGALFTIDHITVEATANGGNTRWVRDTYSHPAWRTNISDVYIDPVGGNDENQGIYTSPTGSPAALKTAQELRRRWQRETISSNQTGVNAFEIIIHILNPMITGDTIDMIWNLANDTYVRILGDKTPTLLLSGTISVFTAANPNAGGGGQATEITDPGVADWTPYLGKRIHFPRVNSYAYVLKDLGSNKARISIPQFCDEPNSNIIPANINPIATDTYNVEDPVLVAFGEWGLTMSNNIFAQFSDFLTLQISNVKVNDNSNSVIFTLGEVPPALGVAFFQCSFVGRPYYGGNSGNIGFGNCVAPGITAPFINANNEGFQWLGGALIRTDGFPAVAQVTGGAGDSAVLDWWTTIQGGSIWAVGDCQIRSSISVWDSVVLVSAIDNGDAIQIGSSGHYCTTARVRFVDRGGNPIWGSGAVGFGVSVGAGNQLIIDGVQPKLTGVQGDFSLGSGYTALPAVDPVTFIPTASRNLTWANLYTTVGGGGFGNTVFNPCFPATGISNS
jgi:hypothetical protein